ncbi:hypothetical protein M5K25_020705 [Dendrobium thyrsiflorum]|uniref:RING-type E3 ubiquitin transferase n=1 Tax=Dendrobium thyrsiflorum TaxID=117978 RepID=A0ABD0UHL8_DENTH
MAHSEHLFLPFEELNDEDDGQERLTPSDPADAIPDWGADDFFVGRRSSASGSNEFSRAQPLGHEGIRIVEFGSEADTDEQIVAIGDSSFGYEADLPFCWECLHVEEEMNDPVEEFEWEDVSDRIDVENPNPNTEEAEDSDRNVEWEVLLSMNRNDAESVFVEEQEGFAYASDYEVLFDQFGGHGGSEWMKSGRPAAKSVVENLPSVLLTAEDVAKKNTNCAVCKDEISLSEEVKRLPCLHYYHEYCIVPWLAMRNTCPLCRHELPSNDTSDAIIIGEEEEEAQARYEFETLQAA